MSVRSGQSVTTIFPTSVFSTGALGNATGTPAGTLYLNGVANAATVTVTNITTGLYSAQVTLPTLAVGDWVAIWITATVSGVAGGAKVWEDTKDFFAGSIPDVAAGGSGGLFIAGTNDHCTITNNLIVSGTTTLTGAVSLGSTLGVTGATTLAGLATGALSGTTITYSGAVAFQSTFAVTGTTTLTGNVSFGGTFGVTGTVTFNAFVCSNNFTVSGNWLTTGTTTWTGAVAFSAGLTANITGNLVGTVSTLTTYTGNTVQTGDAYAYLGTNLGALGANATALASATNLAEANADLDELIVSVALIPTNPYTGTPPTVAQIATAVWTDTTASDFTSVSSPGKILATQLGNAFTTTASSVFATAALANAPNPTTLVLDVSAASHNIAGSIGAAINAAGGSADPLAQPVPGVYLAGTAGYVLGHLDPTDVTVQLPVDPSGNVVLRVGDDYKLADGTQLPFSSTGLWPDLTNAIVTFELWQPLQATALYTYTGTVLTPTGDQQIYFNITKVQTALITPGQYSYRVQAQLKQPATLDDVVTLAFGLALVTRP